MVLPPVSGDGGNVHLPGVPSPPSSDFPWGQTSAGAAWDAGESEALPRVPLEELAPRILFQVSVHQDLGQPTYGNPTPEPRTVGAFSSRFLSPEQIVVSIETVTRNPPRGAGKTSVTMFGSLLILLGGETYVHTVLGHPVPMPLETGTEMRVLLNVVQTTV